MIVGIIAPTTSGRGMGVAHPGMDRLLIRHIKRAILSTDVDTHDVLKGPMASP